MRVQIRDWSGMSRILEEDYGACVNRNAQYEVIDTQSNLLILNPVFPSKSPNCGLNWYLRGDNKAFPNTFAYPQRYTKPVEQKPFVDPAMA